MGYLSKLTVQLESPVAYTFCTTSTQTPLNPLLGNKISLQFSGDIACIACQRKLKKTYQNGYCFPCTQVLAQCDLCVLKPERCHYHLGTCREPNWGESHCMVPHYVYLANTADLKVGITRASNIPTRWIDQGAVQALPIFKVATRQISGFIEVEIAKKYSDKTNWRAMLKGVPKSIDLSLYRNKMQTEFKKAFAKITQAFSGSEISALMDSELIHIDYPVLEYPNKIVSLSFDKTATIEGILLGIKGQYLIFNCGVLNIRKFAGYDVELIS